jgi:hypothetical protein
MPTATVVFCDNISSVYMAANLVHHRRTKHIELDIHFVREKVALGKLHVLHVPTMQQFADVMTKGLPTAAFEEFRSSLCVRPSDALKLRRGVNGYLMTNLVFSVHDLVASLYAH